MIVKKHVNAGRLVLAACDNSLINKRFEDSGMVLDFFILQRRKNV